MIYCINSLYFSNLKSLSKHSTNISKAHNFFSKIIEFLETFICKEDCNYKFNILWGLEMSENSLSNNCNDPFLLRINFLFGSLATFVISEHLEAIKLNTRLGCRIQFKAPFYSSHFGLAIGI